MDRDHDGTDQNGGDQNGWEELGEELDELGQHPFRLSGSNPTEEGVLGSREAAGYRARASDKLFDGRFKTGRLAGLTMWGAIWVLSWPVVLESFLNALVGITDTVLSTRLGLDQADAVGGAAYINWFIGLVIMAIGVSATAMIARGIGAGRMALANATLGQSLVLAVSAGVVLGAFIALGAETFAGALNMTEGATAAFTEYMVIIGLGVPVAAVLFILVSCARGAGDTRRPLYAMALRNLVNIGASYALSGVDVGGAANPFPFDLGVRGLALGTVLGDLAGAGVLLIMAVRGTWGIRILRRRLIPHWTTMWRLIRLATPNFFESLGMWFGNVLVLMLVGMLGLMDRAARVGEGGVAAADGDGLLGAHVIAIRIESLSFLPGFAMGTAAATLAGQYLGARRRDLARSAMIRCAAIGAAVMGAMGVVFITAPRFVTGLMTEQPEHMEITPSLLFICGTVQIPFAIGLVLRTAMRGAGDVRWALALTWISTYLVRLPLAFLFSGVDIVVRDDNGGVRTLLENPMPDDFFVSGLSGLWVALCTDLTIRGVLFTARFVQGGWAEQRV